MEKRLSLSICPSLSISLSLSLSIYLSSVTATPMLRNARKIDRYRESDISAEKLFSCFQFMDFRSHSLLLLLDSDYNQSMNSPEACRRRLLKYVIPVLILSILFNVPKFMEATIEMVPPEQEVMLTEAATEAEATPSSSLQAWTEGEMEEEAMGSAGGTTAEFSAATAFAAAMNSTYDYFEGEREREKQDNWGRQI